MQAAGEIRYKTDVLLESLSTASRMWVDEKLVALERERTSLEARLRDLSALPYHPVDLDELMASLDSLEDSPGTAPWRSRKSFCWGSWPE